MSALDLETNLDLDATDINPDVDLKIKNIDLSVVLESRAPLRWGICATGLIAHDFVASLVGHKRQHEVVAVASRSLDRARKFADEFKIETAYGSYEELAKDPKIGKSLFHADRYVDNNIGRIQGFVKRREYYYLYSLK